MNRSIELESPEADRARLLALDPERRIEEFRALIRRFYAVHGRVLPWRTSRTPYRVLVSELMLQQTQTARVLPKFRAFVRRFPSFAALANAAPRDVLETWQGLGYNRRALALLELARIVTARHRGRLPLAEDELRALPGIGPYTASAVRAFVANEPSVFVETNIRAVHTYLLLERTEGIADSEVFALVARALDRENPRDWYYALMDYGVFLKSKVRGINARSAHYRPQGRFAGSRRELRGAVVRRLLAADGTGETAAVVAEALGRDPSLVERVLEELAKEGFAARRGRRYRLAQ